MSATPLVPAPLLFTAVFSSAVAVTSLHLAKKRHLRGAYAKHLNPSLHHHPRPCRVCLSTGTLPCELCNQSGLLPKGGFSKRNTVRVASLIGTKWTSTTALGGKWRHFICVDKRGKNAKNGVAILSSTCGPVKDRIRLEVNVADLKDRGQWTGGWTTLQNIKTGKAAEAAVCMKCHGERIVMCPRCHGLGQIGL